MRLKDFNYELPKNLIALEPVSPRDQSRLLILDKKTGRMEHRHFYEIIDYLKPGDVLVLNNTKVMRARLIGKKALTGGKIEVFLLNKIPLSPYLSRGRKEIWQCLVGGKGRKENLQVNFASGLEAEIIKNNHDGTWQVKFNKSGREFMKIVQRIGQVPLPPYIKRRQDSISRYRSLQNDKSNYQTVYADNKKIGSVAAPTAGFHFTKKLIKQLKKQGVQFEYVTLRVGLGTFAPVKVDDITKHKMQAEWVEAKASVIKRIQRAQLEGRRVIAVGTTSVRTLESVFSSDVILERSVSEAIESNFKRHKRDPIGPPGLSPGLKAAPSRMTNYAAWTDIFIYPGYKFKIVDAMITNFHLPKSTLIMLAAALAGKSKIFKAYQAAISKRYRFYSYGDAMMIV